MTVQEALNRSTNLVAAAVTGLAGFAFLPEAFIEDKIQYKIDDSLLFLLGLVGIIWYRTGNNSTKRSIAPVILVAAGLVIKIIGVMIEIKEKDDVGDDFGGLILFVLATIFIYWLYSRNKKLNS